MGADDRLRLLFTCCHPALNREAQVALTLRTIGGLETAAVARAFLVPEATIAQRLVRAKRKIRDAAIPYRVPDGSELPARLGEVLRVLYLIFNEGYLASSGDAGERRDLARDAEWLTSLLARLMPDEPEVLGLLALMRLHLARSDARFSADGALVLLPDQDRSLWDQAAIGGAVELLRRVRSGWAHPAPTSSRRPSSACTPTSPSWPRRQLVDHRPRCTTRCIGSSRPRWWRSTGRWRLPSAMDPRRRWRPSSPWRRGWTAITCSTPPEPSCCVAWTARRGARGRHPARSSSPTIRPSGGCSRCRIAQAGSDRSGSPT